MELAVWACGGCVNVHVVVSVCWIKVIRGLDMQIHIKHEKIYSQ